MSEDEITPEVDGDAFLDSIFEGMRQEDADNVVELVTLGDIRDDFEFCGHTFGLRTLKASEEIAVGAALKGWDTNDPKAVQEWATAHVGLALTHIDGDDSFCPPVGPSKTEFAKARYRWVADKYYWPTISYLYEKYTELLKRQQDAIEAAQDF